MNGKQLKNSILQWAIQGKLVPQDPNDEPASVLLEKIWAEKARLVKEGKLKKKDLEVKPIAEDEIPFEIPKGWEWCRFSDLYWQLTDGTHSTPKYKEQGVPFLSVKDMSMGKLSFSNTKFISSEEHALLSQRCHPQKGDLLISKVGTTGIPLIIDTDKEFSIFVSLALIKFFPQLVDSSFLLYLINSPLVQSQVKENTRGVGNKNWVLAAISNTIMVLPPLAEQHRIVAKIEELMPLVEKYGAAQEALDEWNQVLPEKLKKSILQEAIQGKLVPQDPTDEPASVLLERIREEKQRLVKEGKLKKKDLEVKPIEEEEIPFEIPESWEWVRLKTISDKIVDGDHNPPQGLSYDSGYYMLSSKNINHDTIECLDDVRCMSIEDWKKSNERTNLKKGDVLLTTVATLGRSCVYENDIPYCFQRSVSVIHTFIYNYFLKYCFDSPCYQSQIDDKATGTAQRGFYLNQLEESIIPLPPLAEQRRIVAKIEELLGVIKK